MRLYAGTSRQFIEDAVQNAVAEKLRAAFFDHFRFNPGPGEVASWRNSLSRMKDVMERAELHDNGVILEYQLPLSSKRLDCLITGTDQKESPQAVIVELKQWDSCEPADGPNEVTTWLSGAKRATLHPSAQVRNYADYLRDCHTAFGEDSVGLSSLSYLHNYRLAPGDHLRAPKFKEILQEAPLFAADDVDKLCAHLKGLTGRGAGMPVLETIENSKYRASKKLLEHVGKLIKSEKAYVLLDEQQVVYDQVLAAAQRAKNSPKKSVVLIKGGPGTGKSVIALNLMADLSLKGLNAHYVTGSRAFTTSLQAAVGRRASPQFKYFNSYVEAGEGEVDVLILDESHRLRAASVDRFRPSRRSGLSQIDELFRAGQLLVFFIDDLQSVRPDEVGSCAVIRDAAVRHGRPLEEYELEAQFRCSGSDGFVNWVDNTLGIRNTANVLWKGDPHFDFQVMDSPQALDQAIRAKAAQGHSARLVAGFCWPWSQAKGDGTLPHDVTLDGFSMPWNARPEAKRLAPGIPKASVWAYEPGGINQVGCIYTAQGFEFDYVGVIVGPDLVYEPAKAAWTGQPAKSEDSVVKRAKGNFTELVKNSYRVLFSRGLKGCYVYFTDENTRNFFLSRMELAPDAAPEQAMPALNVLQDVPRPAMFTTHLPIYSLAAAAGGFSSAQTARPLGWLAADIGRKLSPDMFIARVKGRSMEPLIPDGAYCVFRKDPGGSRDGKVVLVECADLRDPDTGARYTVKKYKSEKELLDDGSWRHTRITLSPANPDFADIVLENVPGHAFRVAAEFVAVLKPA